MSDFVEIAVLPEWLAGKLSAKPKVEPRFAPVAFSDIDQDMAKAQGRDFLGRQSVRIQGERNDRGFADACRLKDFGNSRESTIDLMIENWKCEPPLTGEEIEALVDNAFQYGQNAPGSDSPQAVFSPVPESKSYVAPTAAGSADRQDRKLRVEFIDDLKLEKSKPALVEGLIGQGTLVTIVGPPGGGKTAFAVYLGAMVAAGLPCLGRKTKRVAVLLLAVEGAEVSRKRMLAIQKAFSLENSALPFAICPDSINFVTSESDPDSVIQIMREMETRCGLSVGLVIIDTLARAMAGGNENDVKDMSRPVDGADRIRRETGATVAFIHHTGKDESKGARGSTALKGAVDTELIVTKPKVKVGKQRDLEESTPFDFRLKPIELDKDDGGKVITSVIFEPQNIAASDAFAKKKPKAGSNAARFLNLLIEIIPTHGLSAVQADPFLPLPADKMVVDKEVWRIAVRERFYPLPAKRSALSNAFNTAFTDLIDGQNISEGSGHVWLD